MILYKLVAVDHNGTPDDNILEFFKKKKGAIDGFNEFLSRYERDDEAEDWGMGVNPSYHAYVEKVKVTQFDALSLLNHIGLETIEKIKEIWV